MIFDGKGFTLIESLLVLSIFMLLTSVTVFSVKPQFERTEKEEFMAMLESDLLFAQQYAISHQRELTVNLLGGNHYYYIRDRTDLPMVVERTFSNDIMILEGTFSLYFKITPSGIVSKFGSFYVQIGDRKYQVTLLIGKGRFYVAQG
ncbi:MAG: competence type IV pilus minor pilin ComGD [Bacillota bacterium]|nr:competence type IV pilus minor pilin ComGD [Bacillota bacterium]MDP4169919.1 competence type IV pilus minor pilin ComGD [Bacillota bacterium]